MAGDEHGRKVCIFAPIWRILQNEDMSVEQVRSEIEYVALDIADCAPHERYPQPAACSHLTAFSECRAAAAELGLYTLN